MITFIKFLIHKTSFLIWGEGVKKTIKIEITLELPEDVEVEVVNPRIAKIKAEAINPKSEQNETDFVANSNQKMTLSVGELAELLGVSVSTIYEMARLKEIPHIKVRGRTLFHRSTIERWLVANTEGGETK